MCAACYAQGAQRIKFQYHSCNTNLEF